jgi:hypothetical protein
MSSVDLNKTIIYDKFLSIESWAYRAKNLIEKGEEEKVRIALKRMAKDMIDLVRLLKVRTGKPK